jgi:hypothetical protein
MVVSRLASALATGLVLLASSVHGQRGYGMNRSHVEHAMRQLQLLVVEKDGFDAWSEAVTERQNEERFLKTGSRRLQVAWTLCKVLEEFSIMFGNGRKIVADYLYLDAV